MIQRRISRSLHISYYNSTGGSYIELPFKSQYIINVKNTDDDMCIIWRILANKFPVATDKQRISKYVDHLNSIIIPSFDFPYNYNNIKKLHKLNNVDSNIFEIDEDKIIKGIIFKSHNNYKGCNLLLYKNHYVLCTNISTILRNSNRMSYPCLNCLTSYSSEQIIENHKFICEEHKATKIIYSHNDYQIFDEWCFKNRVHLQCIVILKVLTLNQTPENHFVIIL